MSMIQHAKFMKERKEERGTGNREEKKRGKNVTTKYTQMLLLNHWTVRSVQTPVILTVYCFFLNLFDV